MNHEHNPNLVIMDLARLLLLVNEVNRRSFFKKHIGTIRFFGVLRLGIVTYSESYQVYSSTLLILVVPTTHNVSKKGGKAEGAINLYSDIKICGWDLP